MLFVTVIFLVLCNFTHSISWFQKYKHEFSKSYTKDFEHIAYKTLLTKMEYIQENSTLNSGLILRLQNMSDVRIVLISSQQVVRPSSFENWRNSKVIRL